MSTMFGRLGDRLLTRFVPSRTARAVKCECRCLDKCFPCCPQLVEGEIVVVCDKSKSCNP
ncbi:hypothetical protein AB0I28_25405 [Phytomonospora sp. NPDC050363]|uniref:hypothetical protein n=1 Tax=Phytomonospora sp. NPDC050363 TaxID=3155642 RepID=UPI0033F50C61